MAAGTKQAGAAGAAATKRPAGPRQALGSSPLVPGATPPPPAHPLPPSAPSAPILPPARFLTKDQVLAALNQEVASSSLTLVSKRYDIAPQQLNDILRGRAGLSKRVLEKLRLRLVQLYERQVQTGKPVQS